MVRIAQVRDPTHLDGCYACCVPAHRGRCALGVPAMRVPPATLDDRRPESRDSWGAIKTPQEQEAVRQELLEEFKCAAGRG